MKSKRDVWQNREGFGVHGCETHIPFSSPTLKTYEIYDKSGRNHNPMRLKTDDAPHEKQVLVRKRSWGGFHAEYWLSRSIRGCVVEVQLPC